MHLLKYKFLIVTLFAYLLSACAGGSGDSASSQDGTDQSADSPYTPPTGGGTGSCSLMSSLACEVFVLVNQERAAQGLPALVELQKCINEAQFHAEDMATNNYFSHDGLTETTAQRFARFGLGNAAWGENIAAGYQTAAAVMNGWMNSSGHRANILGSGFKSMGVGYAKLGQGQSYWVQCFSSLIQ